MAGHGKGASHGSLSDAGFTSGGIAKGSTGADMMSDAYKTDQGRGVVSGLQSSGATGQGLTGSDLSRGSLDNAGLRQGGVEGGSFGANMQSGVDKSGTGGGMKSSLMSQGAKK